MPEGTRGYGHQYTEFAFPTVSDASLAGFLLFPHRPRVVEPLWLIAPDGRSLLVAPLDAFHDQVIAVPRGPERAGEGVACGWHGDLASVPRGFATEVALWAGPGPRQVLDAYAEALRARHGTRRPSRYADASVARLSYWTDNGAAYWYRTEPGMDVTQTLERTLASLREARIPIGSVELDSWFYPHEKTRPVNPEGQEIVPPTGLLTWEPRGDVLPEGVDGLRRRLGDPPLVLHARHFSSASPYFEEGAHEAWRDADRAHPVEGALFERLLGQAADWGAITVEQDWLVEMFMGVRGLRERPGRARAWQRHCDRTAADHGLSLLWCMATPADFLQTVELERVVAIRTSGDYRYLTGNASHWVTFLHTNALARALGLHPFKDVFLSARDGTGWDGDPLAEVEALLSALSAGPVGIGDRLGRSDRDLLLRTCREDGVLVKPDVPIAALERCFGASAFFDGGLLLGEAYSENAAGRWHYVAAFNAWRERRAVAGEVRLADLGPLAPTADVIAYDWRRGTAERLAPDAGWSLQLEPDAWDLRVLCPVLPGGIAVFGDVSRYATMGDRRIAAARALPGGGVELDVAGAPGERVEVQGWSEAAMAAETWAPGEGWSPLPDLAEAPERDAETRRGAWRDASTGVWGVAIGVSARGWARLRLRSRMRSSARARTRQSGQIT